MGLISFDTSVKSAAAGPAQNCLPRGGIQIQSLIGSYLRFQCVMSMYIVELPCEKVSNEHCTEEWESVMSIRILSNLNRCVECTLVHLVETPDNYLHRSILDNVTGQCGQS